MSTRAHWLTDGFFHPAAEVDDEFVDVDDFVRVPVEGLDEAVQLAHVRVEAPRCVPVECVVVGRSGPNLREPLAQVIPRRFPGSTALYVRTERPGEVAVDTTRLSSHEAVAVAVRSFRLAWDESPTIVVESGETRWAVRVTYDRELDAYEANVESS